MRYTHSFNLLWTIISSPCLFGRAEFNSQVGLRVHEHLSEFMNKLPQVLETLHNFRSNHIFPNDMQSQDRDSLFRIGDALLKTHPHDMICVGLEDGTFMGNFYEPRAATYREPGESGYTVVDGDAGEMSKHFDHCVNDTGDTVPCSMQAGASYIECIDGCSLQMCEDDESQSQRNCSNFGAGDECNSNLVKLCKSYQVKQIPEGAQSGFRVREYGFIPRSYFCVNQMGLPTQEPGTISKSLGSELGSCYYLDKETLVNRSMIVPGEYAYCKSGEQQCQCDGASANNETTTTAKCSTTSLEGAFRTIEYDHRYRSWYTDTRRLQKSLWTDPYLFFTNQDMGITFTQPIYTTNKGKKNIFFGVLAVDKKLTDISSFLTENYKGSNTVVTIIEEAMPENYLVASSTGTSGAKRVLKIDITQPCPPGADSTLCKAVRVPVREMFGSEMDHVVSRAFVAQSEQQFPSGKLVAVEIDDMIYASQTKPFIMPQSGINWHILIIEPQSIQSEDTIMLGDSMQALIIAPSILGAMFCSILFTFFWKNRQEREIRFSDWRFTGAFMFGCIFLNLSCLSFIGSNSD